MDTIDGMRTFVAVARESSFTAGAKRLGIGNRVASKYIQQLEERLNTQLFNRTTRIVTLTETGHADYERCMPLLESGAVRLLFEDKEANESGLCAVYPLSRRLTARIRALIDHSAPCHLTHRDAQSNGPHNLGVDTMPGHLEFEIRTAPGPNTERTRNENGPMRMLVCGDFGGRDARGLADPASLAVRSVLRVDVDNLDALITKLAPQVALSIDNATIAIEFHSLDDFHPDSLFDHVATFTRLRDLRRRLQDPKEFAQASTEMMGDGTETADDTIQRLLGGDEPATPTSKTTTSGLDALLHSIVAPHIISGSGLKQDQFLRTVDTSIAELMRSMLHDTRFQAIESVWRSVHFLTTRLDLDEDLQLFIFDVTRAELDATAAETNLEQTGLWKALVDRQIDATGGQPFAMVVALEAFGPSSQDVSALASLATISAAVGAPLIATAAPSLFGCDTLTVSPDHHNWHEPDPEKHPHWYALRNSRLAPWIGLVAPRLLSRLPYGKTTDPVERFEFDEPGTEDPSTALLWGHSGAACALLAGYAFADSGWPIALESQLDVEDLPAWIYQDADERRMYPCAEVWLSERAAQVMQAHGLMVLVSRRDRPDVKLIRWQSIAEPATALAGQWV